MRNGRRLEPGAGPVLGDVPAKPRYWTFMVYLAGDNSLEHYGQDDLLEMKKVGSGPELAIVAQVDRMSAGPTRRYYLTAERTLDEDDVGIDLGETNTGDPAELMRFLAWAMESYPAEHYALVLWNHGTGWKEEDIVPNLGQDVRVEALGDIAARRKGLPTLFRPSLGAILARGIAYDDTSADFLDNAEMKRAIGCALAVAGVEKLDVIGFDACLMSMIEVAYQLREVTHYMVGSQETEPGAGWP
ncbi:MAG: peptidase C11, partial [Chloroflexi bacterium]|nr:peptidase C11 [Chloroflexota bacterium]